MGSVEHPFSLRTLTNTPMKKNVLIILIASIVLLALVVAVLVVLSRNSSSKMNINTQQGTVSANNVNQSAAYKYAGGATLESAVGYAISYDSASQSFNIAITKAPISQYRTAAEAKFLQDLGITQQDACKLNVQLGVTYDANPSLIGQNFGLSFCPGAKAFPNGQ